MHSGYLNKLCCAVGFLALISYHNYVKPEIGKEAQGLHISVYGIKHLIQSVRMLSIDFARVHITQDIYIYICQHAMHLKLFQNEKL